MKTSTQLWLDKKLVKPFVSATNLLVRLVGQLLSLDHSLDAPFKRIAICKFKGMGSIIQATALIATLRKNYPNAHIIFISTKGNAAILKKIKSIDTLVLLDDSSVFKLLMNYPKFILRLIFLKIELYLDLEIYSNFSSLTTTLSMAKNRVGFYLSASQYRLGIYTHMMFFNTRISIMQTYLQMARLLAIDNCIEELCDLQVVDNEYVRDLKLNPKGYIVINPNASDLRVERRWSSASFIQLIEHLAQKYPDTNLVLIGAPNEKEYVDTIDKNLNCKQVINVAGKTSLDELIQIISHAQLLITNDTGPLHMAAACRVPSVALFGPCSPLQYGGMENVLSIYKSVYCSPCVHEFEQPPCKGDNQCMQLISVDEVLQSVAAMMVNPQQIAQKKHIFMGAEQQILGLVKRS